MSLLLFCLIFNPFFPFNQDFLFILPLLILICQALEKVEGQQAWRVRQLLLLALCQGSEEGKPEDVPKTLAEALELATAANLQPLRVSWGLDGPT
jgi:hypothetical protein